MTGPSVRVSHRVIFQRPHLRTQARRIRDLWTHAIAAQQTHGVTGTESHKCTESQTQNPGISEAQGTNTRHPSGPCQGKEEFLGRFSVQSTRLAPFRTHCHLRGGDRVLDYL